jgi:uncharacterized radical SAM protein YgiQ
MEYDIIFVLGEKFSDSPLCGVAILKRLLEKNNYKVGIIEIPKNEKDILALGKPRLFFGISSGSIDSMVRNYTPLKKKRKDDENLNYKEEVPDRAIIVYSNWIKKNFKDSVLVIGGVESSLRRFTHYDYWEDKLRKSILFDSRADILVYGYGEKQCIEIAKRINDKKNLGSIEGTCIKSRELPKEFTELPAHEEVSLSKEKFCEMQNLLDNNKNLAQKTGNFYILQFKFPTYTSKDLDEYYELHFNRNISAEHLKGFEFSVVTHRGCIGNCNFCSLRLMSSSKIISRSEKSIIREVKYISKLPHFKGNIDDLGGPSANMYGMDCNLCSKNCIECKKFDRSNNKLIHLLKELRKIKNVKNIFIRSGIRYDLATDEYLKELKYHISGTLKIAPEHVSENVLKMMNKNLGNLDEFLKRLKKFNCGEPSFYFMLAHPGTTMKEARELSEKIKKLNNAKSVQIFTPTPMTVSTCMYYSGLNPKTKKPIFVPRTYKDKKDQRRILSKFIKIDYEEN